MRPWISRCCDSEGTSISGALGAISSTLASAIGTVGTSSTRPSQDCASLYVRVNEATTVRSAAATSVNGATATNTRQTTSGPKLADMPKVSSGTARSATAMEATTMASAISIITAAAAIFP